MTGSGGGAGTGVRVGTGGNVGTGGGAAAGGIAGTGGAVGTAGATGVCPAGTATTITRIMNGSTAVGGRVSVTGVVATSQKFLASKGSTGDCLWGLFVSEPIAQAVPYSGALVVNLGSPAVVDATGAYGACPLGTDLIPVDAAPGDVFSLNANVITYVRADCAATTTPAPAPEVRVADACAVRRIATAQRTPTPATVPDLLELTNAATEAAHRKWSGVLIKLDNVTATGSVGLTGSIQLTNGVRVRDRIYQGSKTAMFAAATTWISLVGISHLDVCTWSIEPRDPCTDFNPKSLNCP